MAAARVPDSIQMIVQWLQQNDYSNYVQLNLNYFKSKTIKYVEVSPKSSTSKFVFSCTHTESILNKTVRFSDVQRNWAGLNLSHAINVRPFKLNRKHCLSSMVLEANFLHDNTSDPYNSDEMAQEFLDQFSLQSFTVGQPLVFCFQNMKHLRLVVKDLEVTDLEALSTGRPKKTNMGICLPNTSVIFEKAEGSSFNIIGNSIRIIKENITSPDWDFRKMGIGGLDRESNVIIRRVLAPRFWPPELVEAFDYKQMKGILLFGLPGTGKTLIARQIARMLNSREPKIVSGPEILNRYIGESEANIRRLFRDAENEEKKMGLNSGLHVIIFDEIDAICKARGSDSANSSIRDTVVNQLLVIMDGVKQLNNILVIGTTNRKDVIDEALMRPGRMEVQMEIGLPDEKGRIQILDIHTSRMKEHKKLNDDVDIKELACLTENFTGAEIVGLVRAAQTFAMEPLMEGPVDPEIAKTLQISRSDFLKALKNDVKPAFGTSAEQLQHYLACGIILWGQPVKSVLEQGKLFIRRANSPRRVSGLMSILLEGSPNCGKTALAAELARTSNFSYLKVCAPENMVGFTDSDKCVYIRKLFNDAYKIECSCILMDNIEILLDYVPFGPCFSTRVLQTLQILLKKEPPQGRKLLILCTTSRRQILEEMELLSVFTTTIQVPNLSTSEHIMTVLRATNIVTIAENLRIRKNIDGKSVSIGIKKLLEVIGMATERTGRHRVTRFLLEMK